MVPTDSLAFKFLLPPLHLRHRIMERRYTTRDVHPSPQPRSWQAVRIPYLLNLKVMAPIDATSLGYHHHQCADSLFLSSWPLRGTFSYRERTRQGCQEEGALHATPSAPTPGLCLASSHSSPASLPQQDSRAQEVEALWPDSG